MLLGRLASFVVPYSSKVLIDDVIGKQRGDLLLPITVAIGVATLVQAATAFAQSQILAIAAQRAVTRMRIRVLERAMRLPIRYFDSVQAGMLVSRIMADAEAIRNLIGAGLLQLVSGLVTAAAGLGVLWYLNWRLTIVTMLVLGTFSVVMAYAFRTLRPLFRESGKIKAEVSGRVTEALGGIRVVKSYSAEKREAIVFTKGMHRLFRNVARSVIRVSATTAASTITLGLVGVLMTWFGGRAILAGEMSLGDLVSYIFFIGIVSAPVVSIASTGTQITEALAALDRIREILDMPTEADMDGGSGDVPVPRGDVRFEDVWFEYHPDQPVLRGISFEARTGTTTALVGPSGSGKSTLTSLVMAFNRPTAGRVLIDGRDLATIPVGGHRRHLASVLQENFLFDGTVLENVGYARADATAEEIQRACRIAHCDEFIAKLPHGYETIVGERGIRLSGGQRQRVSIARAILANPRILILDEATSTLDSENEQLIHDGLLRLRSGRTTFVIAHRLSTIRSADQILVIDEGCVVERGNHEELLALNGRYKQLYDRQYSLERNRFINPGEEFSEPHPSTAGAAEELPPSDAVRVW